jgi:hypothetical protein
MGLSLAATELAKDTTNECFAMFLRTHQGVLRVNSADYALPTWNHSIFQIAYDERLGSAWAAILDCTCCPSA